MPAVPLQQMPSLWGFGLQHLNWGGVGGGTQTSSRGQPPPTQLIAGSLGPALAPPPCSRLHAGPMFEPPATILLRVTGISTP